MAILYGGHKKLTDFFFFERLMRGDCHLAVAYGKRIPERNHIVCLNLHPNVYKHIKSG